MFGTTLTFLLYSRNAAKVFHHVNYTLQVNLHRMLDGSDVNISASWHDPQIADFLEVLSVNLFENFSETRKKRVKKKEEKENILYIYIYIFKR